MAQAPAGRWIPFSVISPDGREVCYASYDGQTVHQTGPWAGQVRAVDLATGKVTYLPSGWLGQFGVICWRVTSP